MSEMDYSSDGADYGSWLFSDESNDDNWDEYSSEFDSVCELGYMSDDYESVRLGKLVERLRCKEEPASDDDLENVGMCITDMWISLPDEVMMSIVVRLPFSSFCSFRSVCKKWNSFLAYPDASLMVTRDPHAVPHFVVHIGFNQFASYNPSSHSWHYMPSCFGFSFGVLGFQGKESRVVAGASGLLVLESHHMELWVVNPVNKCERRLPPQLSSGLRPISLRSVHLFFDDVNDSYIVFALSDVTCGFAPEEDDERESGLFGPEEHDGRESGLDVQLFDSRGDTWGRSCYWFNPDFVHILSTVKYDGELWCLVSSDSWADSDPCSIYILRPDASVNYCAARTDLDMINVLAPDNRHLPPKKLRAGQFFVRDGSLMLGGVTYDLREGHGFSKIPWAHIWRLNDFETCWREVARMPAELMEELSLYLKPHVLVRGDFMWVTDFRWSDEADVQYGGCHAVMCDMSSDSWWKLPRYLDAPKRRLDPCWGERQKCFGEVRNHCSKLSVAEICPPMLFDPRMDLVV